MRWLDGIRVSMDVNLNKTPVIVKDREPGLMQSVGSHIVGHNLANEQNNHSNMDGCNKRIMGFFLTPPFTKCSQVTVFISE